MPSSPLLHVAKGALSACAVAPAMRSALSLSGTVLSVAGHDYDLSRFRRVTALGAGKPDSHQTSRMFQQTPTDTTDRRSAALPAARPAASLLESWSGTGSTKPAA